MESGKWEEMSEKVQRRDAFEGALEDPHQPFRVKWKRVSPNYTNFNSSMEYREPRLEKGIEVFDIINSRKRSSIKYKRAPSPGIFVTTVTLRHWNVTVSKLSAWTFLRAHEMSDANQCTAEHQFQIGLSYRGLNDNSQFQVAPWTDQPVPGVLKYSAYTVILEIGLTKHNE